MSVPRRRRHLWRDHVYRTRWFGGRLPEVAPPAPEWRPATHAEAEAWVRGRRANPGNREEYRVALENDHVLMLAERDGRELAHRWIGRGWAYISEPAWSLVRFPAGMAYFYDIDVERAHRGQGLGRSGVAAGIRHARELGLATCALWIFRSNAASLRNWMPLGVPWWDCTRLVVSHRGVWLPRPPWRRLGVEHVEWRKP